MNRSLRGRALPLLALLTLAACQDTRSVISPDTAASESRSASEEQIQLQDSDKDRPAEAISRALARRFPGYGGFYSDADGNIRVLMTTPDEAQANGIRALLAPVLRERNAADARQRGNPSARIVVEAGRYRFADLAAWHERLAERVLSIRGVQYTSLRESENRLYIAVDEAGGGSLAGRVRSVVATLGVPADAYLVDPVEPVCPMQSNGTCGDPCPIGSTDPVCNDPCTVDPASCEPPPADPCEADPAQCEPTPDPEPDPILVPDPDYNVSPAPNSTLSSPIRPTYGGLRIQAGNRGACTFGFNAIYNGVRVFATNGHCSNEFGYPEPTRYDQPDYNAGNPNLWYVGREYLDPRFTSSLFYDYRYSDMNLVRHAASNPFRAFQIARTTGYVYGQYGVGSDVIDPANPPFTVTGETGAPYQGQVLDKVGQSTGWTFGQVTADKCIDVRVSDDPRTGRSRYIRCAARLDAGGNTGDSGAPVFSISSFSPGRVALAGLVFRGPASGAYLLFSPIGGIRRDLNARGIYAYRLTTH